MVDARQLEVERIAREMAAASMGFTNGWTSNMSPGLWRPFEVIADVLLRTFEAIPGIDATKQAILLVRTAAETGYVLRRTWR